VNVACGQAVNSVVIAGASGVVGARVLHHLLRREDVGRVIAVGRRILPLQHEKLVSKVVDLQNATAVAAEIPQGTVVAFCCLGTTMKLAGSKEAFRAVDHDAVLAFGRAALERGAKRFLLVSAVGARANSANFYQRTKGEAEEALARLGYAQLTILRPSLIDDEGARRDYRAGERLLLPLARVVFAVVGRTRRYAPISADVIAKAMVRLAFDNTPDRARSVESDELHRLGGSK
jgi:uncharacterized protein YbjT (DUF2867 family)